MTSPLDDLKAAYEARDVAWTTFETCQLGPFNKEKARLYEQFEDADTTLHALFDEHGAALIAVAEAGIALDHTMGGRRFETHTDCCLSVFRAALAPLVKEADDDRA